MPRGMTGVSMLILLAMLASSLAGRAQESKRAFEAGCSCQTPEEMRPLVIEKLGEFESALSRGDLDAARTAKMQTEGATEDVAGWTGAIAIKCLDDREL